MKKKQYDIYDAKSKEMLASDLDARELTTFFTTKGYDMRIGSVYQYAKVCSIFKYKFMITYHGENLETFLKRREEHLKKKRGQICKYDYTYFDTSEFEEATALFKHVEWVKEGGKKLGYRKKSLEVGSNEIVHLFKKGEKKIILGALAELNLCQKEDIIKILLCEGVSKAEILEKCIREERRIVESI